MNWKQGFYAALLRFLHDQMNCGDAVEVTDFQQRLEQRGHCDTCSYTVTIIEITYRTVEGNYRYPEWEGSFGELINELTEE